MQQNIVPPKTLHEKAMFKSLDQIGEWVEDNRRVFVHQFRNGLNHTYVQMIPLNRYEHYQVFFIHVQFGNEFIMNYYIFGKRSTFDMLHFVQIKN